MKVIEFFSGIGGIKCALNELNLQAEVVAAFDINDLANSVYRYNFINPCYNRVIESLTPEYLMSLEADLWTMSPPCQPYTRNGNMMDLNDPRTSAMKHIMFLISKVKPKLIFFENVKGFDISVGREKLLATLSDCKYSFQEFLLSPLQFGVPNSRLRYYLVAKLESNYNFFNGLDQISYKPYFDGNNLVDCNCPVCTNKTRSLENDHINHYERNIAYCAKISDYLERNDIEDGEECYRLIDDKVLEKGFTKLDIVDEISSKTCCFIKCYAKKIEGSGSYYQMITCDQASKLKELLDNGNIDILEYAKKLRLRYFTPREIANFMCFPRSFKFPPTVSRAQRYRLLGNSVNVRVVSHIIHWLISSN